MSVETLPVLPPKQVTLVTVGVVESAGGSIILVDILAVQPLASVTVTVLLPPLNALISSVVAVFDHKKV